MSRVSSETVHASCVAIAGRGVLITGRSGSGKSDLALRLIDRGAELVCDDYSFVRRVGTRLLASAPATIAGKLEVRGIGILEVPHVGETEIALVVTLDEPPQRMPEEGATRPIAGIAIPVIALDAREPSAPIKTELALLQFGLPGSRP
ncbi:HPr kinase/phosphorylase [Flavisphingomonas formosensis]|uniref:HPr kinase/phosphorylase n=1 Tax=Flavisphingomonas formosensis TaxID=861534 RepID=UPI0012F997D8|nr:HPr kinase/phosphatase C-terminal domain-containing protein [Sphingomonas formosensis]